jgi:hypothetical protein
LNTTQYPAAWPLGDTRNNGFSGPLDGETPATVIRSRNAWETFREELDTATRESFADYNFGAVTDYSFESLFAFQMSVSTGGGRLQLFFVESVGTATPRLHVREVDHDARNSAPTRLLLVKLPHEGTIPRGVSVRIPHANGDSSVVTGGVYD